MKAAVNKYYDNKIPVYGNNGNQDGLAYGEIASMFGEPGGGYQYDMPLDMNDLYNMTDGQYKAYWLKNYEETKSAICSDKKRSQAYRELLLAQNDLLCTLTLTRVSSNLAYA